MGIRKQIHIPHQDEDVLEYIREQPNHSQYIVRLVRADMERARPLTEHDVTRLIGEYLRATF